VYQDTLEEGILAIHPSTNVAGIDGSGSCGDVQMCFAKHLSLGIGNPLGHFAWDFLTFP